MLLAYMQMTYSYHREFTENNKKNFKKTMTEPINAGNDIGSVVNNNAINVLLTFASVTRGQR